MSTCYGACKGNSVCPKSVVNLHTVSRHIDMDKGSKIYSTMVIVLGSKQYLRSKKIMTLRRQAIYNIEI